MRPIQSSTAQARAGLKARARPAGQVGLGKGLLDRARAGLGPRRVRLGSGPGLTQARIRPESHTYRYKNVRKVIYFVLWDLLQR